MYRDTSSVDYAPHDSLKLCSYRDLPIWLLRKRHELTGTLWEDVSDRLLEQATDALRDPEEYGERTEEGLEQRPQTHEMHSGDEAIPDVLNDEDYMETDDAQRKTTRIRGGRVLKRPTHLDDYGL